MNSSKLLIIMLLTFCLFVLWYRKLRRDSLQNLITAIIVKNQRRFSEELKYYQGFHDVMSVFLLTLDTNLAFYVGDVVSRFLVHDFLVLNFERGLIPLL